MFSNQLKDGQVLLIEEHLKSKGFFYEPIFYDLLDHLCMSVSSKMKEGLSFIDAFEWAKREFGKDGLDRVYFQTIGSLTPVTRLRNYAKSAWRNIRRQKMYTSINLLGLILGIAVFTTISLYVSDEFHYDTFHPRGVYRVGTFISSNGQTYDQAVSQFPIGKAIKNDVTGIQEAFHMHRPNELPLLRRGDLKFTEDKFYYVDKTFFDVFGYQLIEGDPDASLRDPNSILLTQEAASRYFGQADPMGKTIEFMKDGVGHSLTVTGIVKDENSRSHFKFEILVPIDFLFNYWVNRYGAVGPAEGWFWTGAWTYVKLDEETDPSAVAEQLPAIVEKYFPNKWKEESKLTLDPIESIHLHSNRLAELEPNGSFNQVIVFSTIGFVVLLIAIINFINLMSAQGFSYSKQVGVRKFLGALKLDIVQQYLIESIMLSFAAGLIAILLVQFVLLPEINSVTGKYLSLTTYLTPPHILLFIAALILIGTLAGIYPSLSLAKLNTLKTLKGVLQVGKGGSMIRQSFVVIQFVASVILIISVIVINSQNEFILSMDPGFDKHNVLVVEASELVNERSDTFKDEIRKVAGVSGVSGVLNIPGRGTNSIRFIPEGRPIDQPEQLPITYSDYDLIEVSGLQLASGRFFERSQSTDPEKAFVINEEAAKLFGWTNEEAIGKGMQMFAPGSSEIGKIGKVIGVVKNYNFESVYNPIRPLVIIMHTNLNFYLVKFNSVGVESLTEDIENVWSAFDPARPMESYLMDSSLEELYQKEQKLSWITNYGMGFALVIALIGIFGLSSYLLSRRTKEVGVRRVLGSNQSSLMYLLSRNFLGLILIANVMAIPIGYYLMNSWLQNFVFRVDLSWTAFLIAAITSLVLAFLAIGYHVYKISRTDPINSLRYE